MPPDLFAGTSAVRLPVPHFVFDDYEPYVGCIDYVDAALEWAQAAGLHLLIDLHTAPDSENGFDNGGICGVCTWHTKDENIDRTVTVLEKLAARYKDLLSSTSGSRSTGGTSGATSCSPTRRSGISAG